MKENLTEKTRVMQMFNKYSNVLDWLSRRFNRYNDYYSITFNENVLTFTKDNKKSDCRSQTFHSYQNLCQVCDLSGIPIECGKTDDNEYQVVFEETDTFRYMEEGDACVIYCEDEPIWDSTEPKSKHIISMFGEEYVFLSGRDWVCSMKLDYTFEEVNVRRTLFNILQISQFEWEVERAVEEVEKVLTRKNIIPSPFQSLNHSSSNADECESVPCDSENKTYEVHGHYRMTLSHVIHAKSTEDAERIFREVRFRDDLENLSDNIRALDDLLDFEIEIDEIETDNNGTTK